MTQSRLKLNLPLEDSEFLNQIVKFETTKFYLKLDAVSRIEIRESDDTMSEGVHS